MWFVNVRCVFRFLSLSIHLWHWEPHQPVEHQRNTSAPCSTHLHPAERTSVCGGRNQHQRGEWQGAHAHCVIMHNTNYKCCAPIKRKKIKRECKWWTRIPITKHIWCICNGPLAWLCLLVGVSLTGRYSLRRSADWVAVAHRRRHAGRGSDAAAGFPRQVSPAAGSRHHGRLILWKSAQCTKERRSHCERRGEWHSQHE